MKIFFVKNGKPPSRTPGGGVFDFENLNMRKRAPRKISKFKRESLKQLSGLWTGGIMINMHFVSSKLEQRVQ